jgi:hypothetical protein
LGIETPATAGLDIPKTFAAEKLAVTSATHSSLESLGKIIAPSIAPVLTIGIMAYGFKTMMKGLLGNANG